MNIEWTTKVDGPTKVWRTVLDGVPLDEDSIHTAFAKIWADCTAYLWADASDRKWDIVRVELLEESGRIRIYLFNLAGLIPSVGCEILLPSLKAFIKLMDSAPESSENELILENTLHKLAQSIVKAASISDLCRTFPGTSFRIDACFSGDDEPLFSRIVNCENVKSQ